MLLGGSLSFKRTFFPQYTTITHMEYSVCVCVWSVSKHVQVRVCQSVSLWMLLETSDVRNCASPLLLGAMGA